MSTSQESITGGNGNGDNIPVFRHGGHYPGKPKFTEGQVVWALKRNNGLIQPTSRTLQCSRTTVRSAIKYYGLEQIQNESLQGVTDFTVVKLVEAIKEKQSWAVSLWLKTQAGWSEKNVIEHTGADGKPIQIEGTIDIKVQHEIVAGMVRGHLDNGYTLAEALKNVVLLGIPKSALSLLTKADLQLSNNGHGTYEVLPEESNGNG